MDDALRQLAHRRGGLVQPSEIGGLTRGRRAGLVPVQRGALIAASQPVTPTLQVEALQLRLTGEWAFAGRTALWLRGLAQPPAQVEVAVRDTRQVVLLGDVRVRRLAPSLWQGVRVVDERPLIGLETSVVQAAETLDAQELQALVEDVLRQRHSTPERLRKACRRGVRGSAALRAVLDVLSDGDLEHLKRLLRGALERAGVTGLRSEVPVRSEGGATAYLDLVHDPSRNAVELDGWATHSRRDRFVADRRRDRWVLRDCGLRTTRVAADEARTDLPGVVGELLHLFRS